VSKNNDDCIEIFRKFEKVGDRNKKVKKL